MSTGAIVMMLLATAVVWGGLVLAVVSLVRHGSVEQRDEAVRSDPGATGGRSSSRRHRTGLPPT